MAKKDVNTLKEYFETGDRPTQAQFENLIDSFHHKDSGVIIIGKNYDENTGVLSFDFSDSSTISVQVPLSFEIQDINGLIDALNDKVDKVPGKSLTTNDYTDQEQTKVNDAFAHVTNPVPHVSGTDRENWDGKQDAEPGKGLSTNDYTNQDAQTVQDAQAHIDDSTIHTNSTEKALFSNKLKKWITDETTPAGAGETFRTHKNAIYRLIAPLPFTTLDIEAETSEDPPKWEIVLTSRKTIFVFGNEFELIKAPGNTNITLENGDFIKQGFRDASTIWNVAKCLNSSDPENNASWEVIVSTSLTI